jgi:hypothetical protein
LDPTIRFAVDAHPFHDVAFVFDQAVLFNDVTVTNHTDGTVNLQDTGSQLRYLRRAYELDTTLDASKLLLRARELILRYHRPARVVRQLDLSNVVDDWELVLALDLWDKVTVDVRMLNGDVVSQASLIEGIEITTSQYRDWHLSWWLSVPPPVNFLSDLQADFEYPTPANYPWPPVYVPPASSITGYPPATLWTDGGWVAEANTTLDYKLPNYISQRRRGKTDIVYYVTNVGVNFPAKTGLYGLGLVPSASGQMGALGPTFAVEGRQLYEFTVNAMNMTKWITVPKLGALCHAEILWYDDTNTLLSRSSSGVQTLPAATAPQYTYLTLSWQGQTLRVTAQAPSAAVNATLRFVVDDIELDPAIAYTSPPLYNPYPMRGVVIDDLMFARL